MQCLSPKPALYPRKCFSTAGYIKVREFQSLLLANQISVVCTNSVRISEMNIPKISVPKADSYSQRS